MVDAVDSVKQIIDVVLQIKEAVETVRQNKEDCLRIGSRVERARRALSLCENNAELMKDSAASAALEALGKILGEALSLVTACQERSFMCLCWTAGKLSKQLSKVDQDISSIYSEATFAIFAYLISKQNKDGAHPPHPSSEGRNLLPKIGQVALVIEETVQMVWQSKECIEIDKRVNRISALLSRSGNTETMKDPAMSAQLEKLLKTFRDAEALVTDCQGRNITIKRGCQDSCSMRPPGAPTGRLSKQLSEVLDQLQLTLDDMIAISVPPKI